MAKKSICTACGMEAEGEKSFCGVCGGAMNVVETPDNLDSTMNAGAPVPPMNNVPPVTPNYGAPVTPQQPQNNGGGGKKGLAIAGMCTGIGALVFFWCPGFGIILAIAGLVMSIIGLKSSKRGMALAGVICASIALLLSIIFTAACTCAAGEVADELSSYDYYDDVYDEVYEDLYDDLYGY